MNIRIVLLIVVLWLASAVSAQHDHAMDYPTLSFTLTDEGLQGPDEVESGFYILELSNESTHEHFEPDLIRLKEGATVEQFFEAADMLSASFEGQADPGEATRRVMEVAEVVGGASMPPAVLELTPGDYVLSSLGSTEDGQSFNELGLYRTFTVTESAETGSAPEVDLTVDMLEFAFTIPDEVPAGAQVWEVRNVGEQPHHLILMRIQDGKTLEDVMNFMQTEEGEPPVEETAYTAVLTPDVRNFLPLDLTEGSYVALCFIPDVETGQPHVALGMIDAFTVASSE